MTTFIFVVAFCIVAVLVYMARYSGRLRVAQTRIIDAPVAEVYARVVDLRNWRDWSPWLEHEADAPVTFSDKTDGAGSRCAWNSARIGTGRIEHVRVLPPGRIEQRMRFRHPFAFRGRSSWQFADCQGKTKVTWSLRGRVAFPMRAFAQTVQGMIALDFRYGMDRLAGLVESADAARYSIAYLGVRDIVARSYACTTYSASLAGLAEAMRKGIVELRRQLASHGVQPSGEPIAIYVQTNIKLRTTVCHIGIPVDAAGFDRLPVRTLPAHRAYVVRLRGSRAGLEVAWYQAMQRMRIENIQPDLRIAPFERYLDDPGTGRENDHMTELHVPVRALTE
ncbi:MAG TPA: SRPBCC family protein [Polyangia bacterium]